MLLSAPVAASSTSPSRLADEGNDHAITDNTTAGAQFLAGPTSAAGAVSYRAIASGDLPTATSSAKGAVSINGNGLVLSGDELRVNNTVTAESTEHHLVQYTANGQSLAVVLLQQATCLQRPLVQKVLLSLGRVLVLRLAAR